ncbi:DinB family protein [Brevibacterium jeotgali]|uniref:DinB superfamily protein n=1 Tax=Brevibacterium jeotgali TaxID=1262550 RepID=A0A2H1L6Z3_9MICO|nr:DinB family protein [Brevibacterium jeotgali]TWC01374.1 uncharacterized protein DUF664 [Brevibacterium jeotgali]SMY12153.1 Protein of unknown function (DUF664) [Brevibacterium jeotgali]
MDDALTPAGAPAGTSAADPSDGPVIAAYLAVAGEAFDGIEAVLAALDDDSVNRSPLPGTVNTVFALMTHVHGMACYWGGSLIAGERNPRDRASEFRSRGTVAEARGLLADLRARLPGWVEVARTEGVRDPHAAGTSRSDAADVTAAWALQHVLHEIAQHLGHMEICRDLVVAD